MPLTAGPYFEIPNGSDRPVPFYALRYDKHGRSQGPATERHAIDAVRNGVTDVFVFSHGWNNDWATALRRYKAFIAEWQQLRERHDLRPDREFRPLLAGIFWPSTALVLPSEQGPQFAGDAEEAEQVDVALLADLAESAGDHERLYALAERETLDREEATELLGVIFGDSVPGDPDLDGDPPRALEEMRVGWAKLEAVAENPAPIGSAEDFGSIDSGAASPRAEPDAAGFLDRLDPRSLFRGLTVMQMKDRAGVIGSRGVGPLLARMQDAAGADTRFHLVGHSYGARVCLTAVGHPAGGGLPRAVRSLLLLQPAVNHLCFATSLPNGRAGGFRGVLPMVEQPILSTFSVHDFPLTKTFHLPLRRGKDLGEVEIAADEPPSEYAALGGYGPRGFSGWKEVAVKDPTDAYDLGPDAPEVWAVNASRTIGGHGAVVNPSTAWALFNLAQR